MTVIVERPITDFSQVFLRSCLHLSRDTPSSKVALYGRNGWMFADSVVSDSVPLPCFCTDCVYIGNGARQCLHKFVGVSVLLRSA